MLPSSDSAAQRPAPPGAPTRPLVVGVIADEAALRAAAALLPGDGGAPELLELRQDAFHARLQGEAPAPAEEAVARAIGALLHASPRPLILTLRDPREGGLDATLASDRGRLALLRELSRDVAWIDLELRALLAPAAAGPGFRELAAATRARGGRVIASFHDFRGTPSLGRLRALAARARHSGCVDVFKIATTVARPADLARLLTFLDVENSAGGASATSGGSMRFAVMGMGGALGRASRVALAAAGSVFNYGSLGVAATAPGQWPVARLREILDAL